jgi:hypothetical protein
MLAKANPWVALLSLTQMLLFPTAGAICSLNFEAFNHEWLMCLTDL